MSGNLHTIIGKCHCGNLAVELSTRVPPGEIRARACDCSFCRMHAACNWSDPHGLATIRIADESNLQRYTFGLGTAEFFVCRICGAYLGAVLSDADGTWSTVNLRLTALTVPKDPVSYGDEDESERISRRKRVWTPTAVVTGNH